MNKKELSILGVAALSLGGLLAYARRRQLLARLLDLPPVRNGVTVTTGVRVPMPDGTTLAADHYQPQVPGRGPTVLIRTPYGRGGRDGIPARLSAYCFAERGYHVIAQDTRGRFDSAAAGEFEPYVHEAADGAATIAWIAGQPWSDGQVAMWGASYVGYVQWAAASSGTPYLKALLPIITQAHLGGSLPHGQVYLDRTLRWMLILDSLSRPDLTPWQRMQRAYVAPAQDQVLAAGFDHLPLATVDEAVFGRPVPLYRRWLAHPAVDDPYWQAVDFRARVASVTAPVHLVAGWYDIFLSGQLADYSALAAAGAGPYLTIGPWTHMDLRNQLHGLREGLRWFDAHLLGRGRPRAQAVRLYVMGADEWREYPAWPPPATEMAYHLHPAGLLLAEPAPAGALPDHYRYDPADPTPNLGGPLLSGHAGPRDNRPLEARPDVLTYTTPKLTRPVTVIGPVRLVLYVRSSLEHTDFFGRLCDVQPSGESINICDGILRLVPGSGEPRPDGSRRIVVELAATAYAFRPGHQIRLLVASGAHPRFARNLGTGEPPQSGTRLAAADQTIYHDAAHPSAICLPCVMP